MKKIIFVINNLELGGVQISLLNLINEIHELYNITVLTFFYKEEYNNYLPKDVNLITLNEPFSYFGMSQKDAKLKINLYIVRTIWVILTKIFGRSFVFNLMSWRFKKLKGYDCAISYLHEGDQRILYGGCNEFILKNIIASKKIGWLHCDFNLCGANSKKSKKIYEKLDKIVACSEGTKNSFIECMPKYEKKCIVLRNCNDYLKIQESSKDGKRYENEYFNIVTVARLSEEKGIERAIYAIKSCIMKGFKIKYHIIGYGSQEEKLKKIVKELEIEKFIIFYGRKNNPYKYMRYADLFILPSYHEAAPMVFDEAASLGLPVLATKTISTDEMILQNKSGYVCENSQDDILNTLLEILQNKDKLNKIKERLHKRTFNNKKIIEKFIENI